MIRKNMKKLFILVVLSWTLGSGVFAEVRGRSAEKLPGRSVVMKRLPVGVQRFIGRHFTFPEHLNCRVDRHYCYVYDTGGSCFLLSAEGALQGFRCYMRQPAKEFLDLLPHAAIAYIREHYRGCYLSAFLPEGGGFRAELFGERDCRLRFDGRGRFLEEELGMQDN